MGVPGGWGSINWISTKREITNQNHQTPKKKNQQGIKGPGHLGVRQKRTSLPGAQPLSQRGKTREKKAPANKGAGTGTGEDSGWEPEAFGLTLGGKKVYSPGKNTRERQCRQKKTRRRDKKKNGQRT